MALDQWRAALHADPHGEPVWWLRRRLRARRVLHRPRHPATDDNALLQNGEGQVIGWFSPYFAPKLSCPARSAGAKKKGAKRDWTNCRLDATRSEFVTGGV